MSSKYQDLVRAFLRVSGPSYGHLDCAQYGACSNCRGWCCGGCLQLGRTQPGHVYCNLPTSAELREAIREDGGVYSLADLI